MTECHKSSRLCAEIPRFHKCWPRMPPTFAEVLAESGPDALRGPRPTLAAAQAYCRKLACSHYENFTVVSWLLPQSLQQPFANVYAFCRWADDLADEAGSADQASLLLDWWEWQLHDCYTPGNELSLRHPVFVALAETIREYDIPSESFRDLLSAFRQDQRVTRYETAEDVLDYCRRSANPVGRLILCLGRVNDPESLWLSDQICTGLQLANFCQDVANDWDRGRIYLPQSTLTSVGYAEDQFRRREFNSAFREAMRVEVDRAETHLRSGQPLVDRVPKELRFDVALFVAGGLAILAAIRAQDYNVWASRPTLSKTQKLKIAACAWLRTRSSRRPPQPANLSASYALCRQFARQSASNFAWAFCLLPKRKRMAMYALYAFLRRTDDLGDNESPVDKRRAALDAWRISLDRALAGEFNDPLLPAVADTVRDFSIPPRHLHAVIDGVAIDCTEHDPQQPRFATTAELERYCELVASAVGMACIHIWGFHDTAAIEPARQCGIAFQLTNILRDLRQDAADGRIYLPQEDFDRAGYTPAELRRGVVSARFIALMNLEIARADASYRLATELEKYLDPAAQRIFKTMLTTYRSLLDHIRSEPTAVLRKRVRLSRWHKLAIISRCWLARTQPMMTEPSTRRVPGTAL